MEQGINAVDEAASGSDLEVSTSDERKLGLPFILNVPNRQTSETETVSDPPPVSETVGSKIAELSKEEKKRRRTCKHEGCNNYIVHKGLCCRHGGGKKCSLEGCNSSAKHRGLCWKHGGSIKCKKNGCDKKAKARGLCWAHGGGTKCRDAECTKVAVSNGYCWAHGGGKRCAYEGCIKPAYERTRNLCEIHYAQLRNGSSYEVYVQLRVSSWFVIVLGVMC
ncbi:hypothetical protein PHMEG_00036453 [Phytophthora megakarya]|uniref:WRKY19-like zinc finger domain-containing protein n=1 Tax=Phytophthora megakarya TaxID=4795 RepID=A0A225UM01_9STRA|nr:hypothetical protein PHMEG_00036453 [Phytophthora megakarya]